MVSDKDEHGRGGRLDGGSASASSVGPVAPSAKSRGKKNTFYRKLFIPARGSKNFVQSHSLHV